MQKLAKLYIAGHGGMAGRTLLQISALLRVVNTFKTFRIFNKSCKHS